EHLKKEWVSPVYAFFNPTLAIINVDGHHAHMFKCSACGCKAKVHRYLDKKDACSAGNMRKHVKSCWGDEMLEATDTAKDVNEVRVKIVGGVLRNGTMMAAFERKGKGKVVYSHRPHTRAEVKGFQSLMKMGQPEYYIPSPETIKRDVKRVAKTLREYEGQISFTTDAWTSPNHRAFVAFSMHLEHEGVPLTFPLDVVEVAKVSNLLVQRAAI
ncbi:hypothetical protein PAXRUDRAFT_168183, partial [Paxillus rubicundulus Ve08.2h10]